MKKNFFDVVIGAAYTVEEKINRGLINMKTGAERKMVAAKKGSGWVDAALLCIVGLLLAVAFKDKIIAFLDTIFTKMDTEVSTW